MTHGLMWNTISVGDMVEVIRLTGGVDDPTMLVTGRVERIGKGLAPDGRSDGALIVQELINECRKLIYEFDDHDPRTAWFEWRGSVDGYNSVEITILNTGLRDALLAELGGTAVVLDWVKTVLS